MSIILASGSFILTAIILPESPRYLYSKHKFEEALTILQDIQKINNRNIAHVIQINNLNQNIDSDKLGSKVTSSPDQKIESEDSSISNLDPNNLEIPNEQ